MFNLFLLKYHRAFKKKPPMVLPPEAIDKLFQSKTQIFSIL
jgi:hypothetical protein